MRYTEDNWRRIKDMDLVLCFTIKTEFMKEGGKMIKDMEKVMRDIKTETDMKEIFKTAKLTGKEFIIGLMEKFMMENGIWE